MNDKQEQTEQKMLEEYNAVVGKLLRVCLEEGFTPGVVAAATMEIAAITLFACGAKLETAQQGLSKAWESAEQEYKAWEKKGNPNGKPH